MRLSAPVRHLLALAGLFAAGLALLALHAGEVEAGPGAARLPSAALSARADSDTAVVALDSLGRALADVLALVDGDSTVSGDSTALGDPVAVADSMAVGDSTARGGLVAVADTVEADTLVRSRAYFPTVRGDGADGAVTPRRRPGLSGGPLGPYWQRSVTLDSTAYQYAIRETVGGTDVRAPVTLSLDSFLVARRQTTVRDGFRELAGRRNNRTQRRSGLGITVDVPGGQNSTFSTIFGKNEVDLRVNGTSTVDVGAGYDTNELQDVQRGRGSFSPAFGQELNLNVAGTIGDKLRINVNYDTQSQFDFENKVSLVYTGYEDDIVQRFEAGNVFLQTPSELIRGGQRLFGLRTDLQFGPLSVTAVASQQDAQSNEVVIEGGSQATPFALDPFQYENDTHFFIGFAFHNWWDAAHRRPGLEQLHPNLSQIEAIEVWKHDQSLLRATDIQDETTWAIALADLGEEPAVIAGGKAYLGAYSPTGGLSGDGGYEREVAPLPNGTLDRYAPAQLDVLRANANSSAYDAVTSEIGAAGAANRRFRKLVENVDYRFDAQLGWVSLTSALADNEILAVSYRYRTDAGDIVTVGDFGDATKENSQNGPRIVLKLLRNDAPVPTNPLWDLTLRNVYRVGGRSLNPANFVFRVDYEAPGATPQQQLPGLTIGENETLLTVLGLDRVNGQGQGTPDNEFDFIQGVTIEPGEGRVIFPVRQPFGDYIERVVREGLTAGQTPLVSGDPVRVTSPEGLSPDAAAAAYAFPDLYDRTQSAVRVRPGNLTRYTIAGESKSATQSIFNAGFNLVEGSVRVTADGERLQEGVDYRVNYTAGQVEIVNAIYLQSGKQIRVESEQQKFASIGGKTLLGLRADYDLGDDVAVGATFMRLNERPLVGKFRVGEEALRNGILGLDGRYEAEPLWITRALDALPLIQTRADSRVSVRGEFARLLPGHPQTLAFSEAQRRIANNNSANGAGRFNLPDDELGGSASYIDDFEGSETAYTDLEQTPGWRLAAVPDSAGPPGPRPYPSTAPVTDPQRPTNWRGLFTWYSLGSKEIYDRFDDLGQVRNDATRRINEVDLFPDRDFSDDTEARRPIGSLDLYFDPTTRGPYNYNLALDRLDADPRTAWGGMTQAIRNSYSDFGGQNNIEFVELLFAPLAGRNGEIKTVNPGAVLYIDLGRINEDILPNGQLNSEDGITDRTIGPGDPELDAWGRLPVGATNGVADLSDETGRTEDLGLDGLPSRRGLVASGGEEYGFSERDLFAPFVDALLDPTERARAELDPSADDYHHFAEQSFFQDPTLFPGGSTVQERYAYFYPATELNTIFGQDDIARPPDNGTAGISRNANSEDINANSSLDATEQYHRYRIPLNDEEIRASPFFQNTIENPNLSETWYLLRIPIRTDADARTTSPGLERDDFSRIESVRLWTTGHEREATIRIKSFELVGSQWLKSDLVGAAPVGDDGTAPVGPEPSLFIESINNEENASLYAPPRGIVFNTSASLTGGTTNLREQSIVFRAEGLADGRDAGIVRSYATRPIDLTKYSNLRAYVHGHGYERSDSVEVFLRVGDDETENFYEYSQPVYPFDPRREVGDASTARSDSLWQTTVDVGGETVDRNSINLVLSELNQLKVARDNAGAPFDTPFRSTSTPEGAPAGARLAIVGQPSIQDVKTIVLGIRNREGGRLVVDTVTVWFNELRVTGYDEAPAASGFLAANVQLADIARLDARYNFTQDGFGGLDSGLGEREFSSRGGFTLTSQFSAHKLLPERYGWSIPVSFSYTDNQSNPRFDPDRGDIRVSELVDQARTDSLRGEAERVVDAEEIRERTQTVARSSTFRTQVSKTGSRSRILEYTIDKLSASYSTSSREERSPVNAANTADSWQANAAYSLTVPKPKTVTPFWLLRPVPVLGSVLGGLQLNVLPRQFSMSANAARSSSSTLPRLRSIFEGEPDSVSAFRVRPRRNQRFDHGRRLDLGYSPFTFLQLGYGSNVAQDLGALGQDETFRVLVRDTTAGGSFSRTFNVDPLAAREPDSEVYRALVEAGVIADGDAFPSGQVEILGGSNLQVAPFGKVVARLFRESVRTQRYDQTASARLTVSTAKVKWLQWIRPQEVSYQTSYSWADQPIAGFDDLDIAGVGTRAQVQSGLQLQPRELFRLFPFYRKLETADKATAQQSAQDSTGGGFRLDPVALARKTLLAVTGVNDATVTYRGSLTSSANGVSGDGFSLISGFQGRAPSLGYRLGLDRTLPLDLRLRNDEIGIRQEDVLGDQHDLEGRTSLQPFSTLRVNLTWKTGWQSNEQIQYDVTGGTLLAREPLRNGSGESSVLAIGGSYESFLDRQGDRLAADIARGETEDGFLVSETLTRTGLAADFQDEFGRGVGRYGPAGLFTIPLPSWDVNYSGLSKWPLFKRIAQNVSVRHGYFASSRGAYSSSLLTDQQRIQQADRLTGADGVERFLIAPASALDADAINPETLTLNERFQPLVGVQIGWKGGLQTDVNWSRSNLYTLNTSSAQLIQKNISDLQLQVSFSKVGLKLPGLKKLNNNIRLTLSASAADDQTLTRQVSNDLQARLTGVDGSPLPPVRVQRYSLWPRLSYSISNQVTADFFVRYEAVQPKGGNTSGSTSSLDSGVSFRISFSN